MRRKSVTNSQQYRSFFTLLTAWATRQPRSPADESAESFTSTGTLVRLKRVGTSAQTTNSDSGGTTTGAWHRNLAIPLGISSREICCTRQQDVKAFSHVPHAFGETRDLKAVLPRAPPWVMFSQHPAMTFMPSSPLSLLLHWSFTIKAALPGTLITPILNSSTT